MKYLWETEYRHDRRKARHRCRCCRRIIEAGEHVLMMKHRNSRGTWAVHLTPCAEAQHSERLSWREVFTCWTMPPAPKAVGGPSERQLAEHARAVRRFKRQHGEVAAIVQDPI